MFAGNLAGSLLYAVVFLATTEAGTPIADKLIQLPEAKIIGYQADGGLQAVFFKAVLCNWMVTMGVVMAMTSTTTSGKIAAMWLLIMTFFAQGFEQSVMNMFVIPAGMILGADVSAGEWWLWNRLPVTLGNIVGGALFTGLALYLTYGKHPPISETATQPAAASPAPRPAARLESAAPADGS